MSGVWRLVAPAEDATSVRTITDAEAKLVESVGKQLGLRVTRDDGQRKLYLGLPLKAAAIPVTPVTTAPDVPSALPVRYYAQLDSATSQGPRMCFSSSCAMLAKFLKPNALSDSPNADDEYLRRVQQYGDTTEATAQIKALAHLGVKATFERDLTWADLDRQLSAGKPVPIGILHRGHVSAPSGGGHWIVVIGKVGESYRVHDPAGNLDLVSGQYVGGSGSGLLYSKKNLGPRWMVDGPGTGWGILA